MKHPFLTSTPREIIFHRQALFDRPADSCLFPADCLP
jgi:hypothetical protein